MIRRQMRMVFMAFCAVCALTLTGCGRDYKITVSDDTLWFSSEESSQTIEIVSEGGWTIQKNEQADWYSVSPTSGTKGSATLTIQVNAYDGNDHRDASFTIVSEGRRKNNVIIRITQNLLEFGDITNTVFGVSKVEHWNTDAQNVFIEDSYVVKDFNPNDTATGYTMFFLENGTGVQTAHLSGVLTYYVFTYEYDPINRNLHVEFESVDPSVLLLNDAKVITASYEMFRFEHEYREHFWERAEMKKIGTIDPDAKDMILRMAKSSVAYKKKGLEDPIFDLD